VATRRVGAQYSNPKIPWFFETKASTGERRRVEEVLEKGGWGCVLW